MYACVATADGRAGETHGEAKIYLNNEIGAKCRRQQPAGETRKTMGIGRKRGRKLGICEFLDGFF